MEDLARKSISGPAQFVGALGILLFAPCWTFDFWQAWTYLAVFTVSVALITVYLWKNDRQLLERRVNAGPGAEKEKSQKRIQSIVIIVFVAIFILCSLDHRFSWSRVPVGVVMIADFFVISGFFIVYLVFKENTFASGTIETAADQKVISTGPYALVRHPMYLGALIMLCATPLALGSWWGLILFIPMTLVIVWRLLEEETFLLGNLQGYDEYKEKIRYRLLPFVW